MTATTNKENKKGRSWTYAVFTSKVIDEYLNNSEDEKTIFNILGWAYNRKLQKYYYYIKYEKGEILPNFIISVLLANKLVDYVKKDNMLVPSLREISEEKFNALFEDQTQENKKLISFEDIKDAYLFVDNIGKIYTVLKEKEKDFTIENILYTELNLLKSEEIENTVFIRFIDFMKPIIFYRYSSREFSKEEIEKFITNLKKLGEITQKTRLESEVNTFISKYFDYFVSSDELKKVKELVVKLFEGNIINVKLYRNFEVMIEFKTGDQIQPILLPAKTVHGIFETYASIEESSKDNKKKKQPQIQILTIQHILYLIRHMLKDFVNIDDYDYEKIIKGLKDILPTYLLITDYANKTIIKKILNKLYKNEFELFYSPKQEEIFYKFLMKVLFGEGMLAVDSITDLDTDNIKNKFGGDKNRTFGYLMNLERYLHMYPLVFAKSENLLLINTKMMAQKIGDTTILLDFFNKQGIEIETKKVFFRGNFGEIITTFHYWVMQVEKLRKLFSSINKSLEDQLNHLLENADTIPDTRKIIEEFEKEIADVGDIVSLEESLSQDDDNKEFKENE
ncbi:MAG: hypothetical protein ACP5G1_03450 [Nanopusillaceae archaeon]